MSIAWVPNGTIVEDHFSHSVGIVETKTDDGWLYIRGIHEWTYDPSVPYNPTGFTVLGKAVFNPDHKGSAEFDDTIPEYLLPEGFTHPSLNV